MAFPAPSSAFIDALRYGSTLVSARCTIWSGGVSTLVEIPVSDVSVTVSRSAAQRRTATITAQLVPSIPPQPIMPVWPGSLLAPFGNEIFVETGLTVQGEVQWVPLGLFTIVTSTVQDTSVDLQVTLDCYDRSWVISQRQFIAPYNVPATPTANLVDELTALLNKVWGSSQPPLRYNITPTAATVPAGSYNQGADPWQAALDMATAAGYELFFDAQGVVTGYPIPVPATQPVTWNFTDDPTAIFGYSGTGSAALNGSPYSTPVATTLTMTRDGIYNDVIVTGTGTQNAAGATSPSTQPVLGRAQDTNPSSSTYVHGPVGDIPQFVSTGLVLSEAQADATALNDLEQALAAAWTLEIAAAPNPIFDVDDVVTVTRPRLGLSNVRMVLDEITHTISYANTMTLQGRVVVG